MSNERDINDVFDTILLSEEKIIGEAYEEGYAKGKKDGEIDGFHAGYHRGANVGFEIGYYKGVVNCILSEKLDLNEKTKEIVGRLRESLEAFPKTNADEMDLFHELGNMRAQYKKLCSVMKLKLAYPTTSNMSF